MSPNQLSQPNFVERIMGELALVSRLFRDRRTPIKAKAILIATGIYVASPIDFMSGLPFDDMGIMYIGIQIFLEMCPSNVVAEHRAAITRERNVDAQTPVEALPLSTAIVVEVPAQTDEAPAEMVTQTAEELDLLTLMASIRHRLLNDQGTGVSDLLEQAIKMSPDAEVTSILKTAFRIKVRGTMSSNDIADIVQRAISTLERNSLPIAAEADYSDLLSLLEAMRGMLSAVPVVTPDYYKFVDAIEMAKTSGHQYADEIAGLILSAKAFNDRNPVVAKDLLQQAIDALRGEDFFSDEAEEETTHADPFLARLLESDKAITYEDDDADGDSLI